MLRKLGDALEGVQDRVEGAARGALTKLVQPGLRSEVDEHVTEFKGKLYEEAPQRVAVSLEQPEGGDGAVGVLLRGLLGGSDNVERLVTKVRARMC